jgi:CRISPR-associated protein Cmr6
MPIDYHPSDTTEVVKSELVFELQNHYVSALNRGGAPSQNLRNLIGLSNNAYIEVESRNHKWLITDEKNKFLVRNEHNNLKVYKRPTIENCALEYRYFLEIDSSGKPAFPKYLQQPQPEIIKHLRERQTQQLLQFATRGIKLYCVDATVDWRLIIGLGSEHILETNMALHHIYGIPYIPGSAVKGVLRHWWFQVLQQDKNFIDDEGKVDEIKALNDPDFLDFLAVFGSQKQRGEVQFLDAYPDAEKVHFATDIMNPHYSKYYGGDQPPTDHQNPVPINFLTVENTTFRFAFLAKDRIPLDKLKDRFQKALELKGVGAKTAVGYGYFRDFTDQTDTITSELKRQQQVEQELTERQREAERLASLSPIEQLAEELNRLTDNPTEENRSIQIYNEQLPALEGDDKQMIAQALKAYWQRVNKWKGPSLSDKQREKVNTVQSILA